LFFTILRKRIWSNIGEAAWPGAYPGFILGGAQNPIFQFFTIFSPILAIFP